MALRFMNQRRKSRLGYFQTLTLPEVEAIARKELSELAAREGLAAANVQLTWSERLDTALAREGYDHRFGARPSTKE